MKSRTAGLIVALGLLAAPSAADAQQAGKVPRIGFLCWAPCAGPHYEALWQGLRELGYADYRNISAETRTAAHESGLLPRAAADLVQLKVDVIVADSTLSAVAAKNATTKIPIVAITDDPVGSGLVSSLPRPGGNVTGVSLLVPELSLKRLELLKEVLPTARRVAILWNPAIPAMAPGLRDMEVASRALGVALHFVEVPLPGALDRAFEAATREGADALIAFAETRILMQPALIVGRAARSRLPAIYDVRDFVEAGGLISYGPSAREVFRRAATYVDKILRGAKPADLPVEQPTRFELVINLKTAKALGLTIPQSLLIRADQVIQ